MKHSSIFAGADLDRRHVPGRRFEPNRPSIIAPKSQCVGTNPAQISIFP
jgi:hypothetical protein